MIKVKYLFVLLLIPLFLFVSLFFNGIRSASATSNNPIDTGDGSDGNLTISVNTVDSPIDSSASGLVTSSTLNATNPSFAAGQKILIHQTQGTGAGNWEINEIAGYTSGEIAVVSPLSYTYSGKAQVLVLKQYADVDVDSGVTWSAKAWDGTTGGILAYLANGTVTINGTVSAYGKGFRGGPGLGTSTAGVQGEGESGIGLTGSSANGIGGGGGTGGGNFSAGGGGYGTIGIPADGQQPGAGGGTAGTTDLAVMLFGGGGGAGTNSQAQGGLSGAGGTGGGIVFISAATINVSGGIVSDGFIGGSPIGGDHTAGNGGGGAGGSILLKAQAAALGANLSTASWGPGGSGSDGAAPGGRGGLGRIRIEYCDSFSGSTSPSASTQQVNCPTPIPTPTPTPTPTPSPIESNVYMPFIIDSTLDNAVYGEEWPLDVPVTLTIDDPTNGSGIDFSDVQTPNSSNLEGQGVAGVSFQLGPNFTLVPGMIVKLTNGNILKIHIVTPVVVTSENVTTDQISGDDTPFNDIWVACGDNGVSRFVTTDSSGHWSADFSVPGPTDGEQDLCDIQPGTGGFAIDGSNDQQNDFTKYDWQLPEPTPTPTSTPTPLPQITALSPANVWVGLKNSDAVGIKFDFLAEVYKGASLIGSGQLDSAPGGSSGFANAKLNSIPLTLFNSVSVQPGDQLSVKIYVRNACVGSGKNSGTARLWYNDSQANSHFDATIDTLNSNYYLLSGFVLGYNPGPGPKENIEVVAGAKCSAFKTFGTWSVGL